MDIKAVLKNLKNKGIKKTYRLYKENKRVRKMQWKSDELKNIYVNRTFAGMNDEEYRKFMDDIYIKESSLKADSKKLYKIYMAELKREYVKERMPELYEKLKNKPVRDKVVFMENGNSPSPSGAHLADVLTKQGKYEIVYRGLKIRQVSYIEYYENALKLIEDMADAKAVFLSTANDILSQFDVRPETKIIQLWHGVGVFKKIGYSTMDNDKFGKSAAAREEYNQYRNYSYVTIPSPEQAWIFEDAMHIDRNSGILAPIGVSRTDVFYDSKYLENTYKKLYDAYPQIKGKKILLYVPTFRGSVANAQAPDKLDIDEMGERLSNDYVLLIKHHGLSKDVPEIPKKWNESFAFDIGVSKVLGIERLLAIADICITDYSSVAFEFAIMERPIIFFAYDLDDYIDKRGMYYDYDEITPGPVCRTNDEMIDYIEHIDENFDKQVIKDFKEKYVGCCDGHSTERTIELIEK